MKKFTIGATSSGCGKTTLTMGLLRLYQRKGLVVQAYKVGPDFVDPEFHSRITGRPARNLDQFLVPDSDTLRGLFDRASQGADLALIEGVMGLFDGASSDRDDNSTAGISKQLGSPVLLCVDGRAASTSVAAMVHGFSTFDPGLDFLGVIVNKVSSESHYQLIRQAIERYTGVEVLGYLPKNPDFDLPSRSLGLVPAGETDDLLDKVDRLADQLETTVDWQGILDRLQAREEVEGQQAFQLKERTGVTPASAVSAALAASAALEAAGAAQEADAAQAATGAVQELAATAQPRARRRSAAGRSSAAGHASAGHKPAGHGSGTSFTVAYAYDQAFHFYYQENLEALAAAGAKLVSFSPLEDSTLPRADLYYVGGGYPFLYAEDLAKNRPLLEKLRKASAAGAFVYGEGSGLVYLTDGLEKEGHFYPLAGLLPGRVHEEKRLQHFGYTQAETLEGTLFGEPGSQLRGHSFHHEVFDTDLKPCLRCWKEREGEVKDQWEEGYQVGRTFASFLYLHFCQRPDFLQSLVEAIRTAKSR